MKKRLIIISLVVLLIILSVLVLSRFNFFNKENTKLRNEIQLRTIDNRKLIGMDENYLYFRNENNVYEYEVGTYKENLMFKVDENIEIIIDNQVYVTWDKNKVVYSTNGIFSYFQGYNILNKTGEIVYKSNESFSDISVINNYIILAKYIEAQNFEDKVCEIKINLFNDNNLVSTESFELPIEVEIDKERFKLFKNIPIREDQIFWYENNNQYLIGFSDFILDNKICGVRYNSDNTSIICNNEEEAIKLPKSYVYSNGKVLWVLQNINKDSLLNQNINGLTQKVNYINFEIPFNDYSMKCMDHYCVISEGNKNILLKS